MEGNLEGWKGVVDGELGCSDHYRVSNGKPWSEARTNGYARAKSLTRTAGVMQYPQHGKGHSSDGRRIAFQLILPNTLPWNLHRLD